MSTISAGASKGKLRQQSWFCSEVYVTPVAVPGLHYTTIYQGYPIMRQSEQGRTFQFQGRFARCHLKNQNKSLQCDISECDILWQQSLANSSSGLSGNSPSEVITLHIILYLILEEVMLQWIFMICLVSKLTFITWHLRLYVEYSGNKL